MNKTLYYLKRAVTLPPHVVAIKLLRKLKNIFKAKKNRWIDEAFPTYELQAPSEKGLRHFIKAVDSSLLPKEEILELCQHYLEHEFDLLGSGWVKVFPGMECKGIEGIKYPTSKRFGVQGKNKTESERIQRKISKEYQPIDWQIDFKSGYRWDENIWSQDIRYGQYPGADVKVPWELGRMQHLVMLGWGYALEKDAKYLLEFQNQILDFMASNPPRYGVNWACTMDVGIRVANWLFAYDLFRSYGAHFSPEFEKLFMRSIQEHGKHIFLHLEWDPLLRSNHYLANIAGLLFVAVYMNDEAWLSFALRELKAEVGLQFQADGSNFEASTSYHRLSAEMVLYATALSLEIGVEFPEEFLDRIQKMADFIRDFTKPDGTIFQFGDNDSGRFIKLFPDELKIKAIRKLKNLNAVIQAQLGKSEEKGEPLSLYPDFGLYIQRKDPWVLAIRCGSIGQKGNGGHAHNDQLSFELAVSGVSCIVDPGTYVYTPLPERRRQFRSAAMHNTLVVLGKEQNEDEGLFRMKDTSQAKVLRFEEGLFMGEHQGFGLIHRRTLHIHKSHIEGIDECDLNPKEIRFHFAPGWILYPIHPYEVECRCGALQVRMTTEQGMFKTVKAEISKGYGRIEEARALVLKSEANWISWQIRV